MSVVLDKHLFWNRLNTVYTHWNNQTTWNTIDSWLLVNGKRDENIIYQRTLSMHLYLTSFELFDTIMLFKKDRLCIAASSKKIALLEQLKDDTQKLKLELLLKEKGKESELYGKLIEIIAGGKVGMLTKDNIKGAFAQEFVDLLKKTEGIDIEDIALAIAEILHVKDEDEIEYMRKAANVSSLVLTKQLIPVIEEVIVDELQMKHLKLAESCEDAMTTSKKLQKLISSDSGVAIDEIDSCYTPIIMSGGKYSLKPSVMSNEENLQYDTIVISLGARYHSYCSNIGRTLLINASRDQKRIYNTLIKVREACIAALEPRNAISEVYKAAIKVIRARDPELETRFSKNCGFGLGLDFRDSSLILNGSNTRKIKSGMVFNVCVGFQNLRDMERSGRKYALLVADTVLARPDGAEILTDHDLNYREISYKMDLNEDITSSVPMSMTLTDEIGPTTRSKVRSRDKNEADAAQDEQRRLQQKALSQKKQREALKRFAVNAVEEKFDVDRQQKAVIECYESIFDFPSDAPPTQLHVDVRNEALLVPINGQLVPFHVDTIKSISDQNRGETSFLRVTFLTPDVSLARKSLPPYADRKAIYIGELTYKSRNSKNLKKVMRLVKELQKRIMQREIERKEEATLVAQKDLILNRDRKSVPRLRDLSFRPKIGRVKASTGMLEAHVNGFRFVPFRGERVDFLYTNIKHAIFQPCDKTISVILHFQLKSPIKIGKKRVHYIQVFKEVVETSQDLGRHRGYDRDGLMEEREERRRRKKFNERFRSFVKSVEELLKNDQNAFEFDRPYRELSFGGVPTKSEVVILPTLYCLVALDDNPPFVLTLDEVEVAYFERVQLSLKSFDLVFVYKDFERPVEKLRSISTKCLSNIQSYLNESDIMYFVGPMNLQWPRILKQIRSDLKGFFEMGGWESILGAMDDDEVSGDEASEFELVDDVGGYSEHSEEYMSDRISEHDEDESLVFEEDAVAPSWEELEAQAREHDSRRNFDEDDARKAKKRRRH